jgi:hypothetical protein
VRLCSCSKWTCRHLISTTDAFHVSKKTLAADAINPAPKSMLRYAIAYFHLTIFVFAKIKKSAYVCTHLTQSIICTCFISFWE